MKKGYLVLAAAWLAACSSHPATSSKDTSVAGPALPPIESGPFSLYTNDAGEEIFGDDYEPSLVENPGTPLEVARISTAARMFDTVSLASHDMAVAAAKSDTSLLAESVPGTPVVEVPELQMQTSRNIPWPVIEERTFARTDGRPAVPSDLFVHFVDVGQGDATILEFPCGVAVIDTGGQYNGSVKGADQFVAYLDSFFDARPELGRTINVLFTTHPHADHLGGLAKLTGEDGALSYRIENLVDNGQSGIEGSLKRQTDFRSKVTDAGGAYSAVYVARLGNALGATNATIDPLDCTESGVDPEITVLWGGWDQNTIEALGGTYSGDAYRNPNNHSLVIRVDFGDASLLFTGDLEDIGVDYLSHLYDSTSDLLDVDVYQVGHHGARNGTTDEFIGLMSPEIAVISMGDKDDTGSASATAYGHPRLDVLDLMQDEPNIVSDARSPALDAWAFEHAEEAPGPVTVTQAIYGTGWEGDIVLRASSDGTYEIISPAGQLFADVAVFRNFRSVTYASGSVAAD